MPQMKKVGNFLIDLDRYLGQGQYGKVYLAQLIPESSELLSPKGDTIAAQQHISALTTMKDPALYACKVVERKNLCATKENLIVSEI